MKTIILLLTLSGLFSLQSLSQKADLTGQNKAIDKVQALKDTLEAIENRTDIELFKQQCSWFREFIEAQPKLTAYDSANLSATYDTFCITNPTHNGCNWNTYLQRQRPIIVAWTSPTDGEISMACVVLPINWNPEIEYPLYIHLHGLSSTTDLPIDFLTRYFLRTINTSYSFEDGYLVYPWGRGNLWYQGISETDIYECREFIENLFKINYHREYLKGHSMGGYGAWLVAGKTAETWAALGIEAGALWYNNGNLMTSEYADNMVDLPTYFVTGTQDGLLSVNQQAYNLLTNAGNQNTIFVTFEGGHEHLDVNEEALYEWVKVFENENYNGLKEKNITNEIDFKIMNNSSSGQMTISFELNRSSNAQLKILNILGQTVNIPINQSLSKGDYSIPLNKNGLPSVFIAQLIIENKVYSCKVIK